MEEEARGSAASGLPTQADKAAMHSSIPVDEAPAEIPGASSGGAAAIYQGHQGHSYPRYIQLPGGDAAVPVAKVFAQNDSEKHSLDSAMKCAEAPTGTQNDCVYCHVPWSRLMELRTIEIAPKTIEALHQQKKNLEGAVEKIIEDCTQEWDDKFDETKARSVMCSSSIFFA